MPSLISLFISFVIVGFGAWGGGTVAIPLIHHEVVEKNTWITEEEITNIIALSQMTPGPLAVNAATYVGFRVRGITGAVVCTAGVVTPAALILSIVIFSIKKFGRRDLMTRFRHAIGPAVLGLIALAAWAIGKVVITDISQVFIFLVSVPAFFTTRGKLAPVWVLGALGLLSVLLP